MVRRVAAWALGRIGISVVPSLLPVLQDENEAVRRAAINVLEHIFSNLVNIGGPAVDSLIRVLQIKHWRVREGAIRALGEIGDPRAIDSLKQALQDENKWVQLAAKKAIKKIQA